MWANKTPMQLSITEFALITGLKFSSGANQRMGENNIREKSPQR